MDEKQGKPKERSSKMVVRVFIAFAYTILASVVVLIPRAATAQAATTGPCFHSDSFHQARARFEL
jgi:hypothetical protein